MSYTSSNEIAWDHQPTHVIFEKLQLTGMRKFSGHCPQDNLFFLDGEFSKLVLAPCLYTSCAHVTNLAPATFLITIDCAKLLTTSSSIYAKLHSKLRS